MGEWHDKYESDDDDFGEEWKGKKNEDENRIEIAKAWLHFLIQHRNNMEKIRGCLERMKKICNHEDTDKPEVDEPPSKTNTDNTTRPVIAKDQIVLEENVTGYMEVL